MEKIINLVPVETDALVVICGVGRSGTSLLQSMLSAHSTLGFLPETHFFRRYVAKSSLREWMETATIKELASLLGADKDFGRVGLDPLRFVADTQKNAVDGPFAGVLYRKLLRAHALREGKVRVGDKDPKTLEVLPQLRTFFPRALVIHIVRDPRDVLVSRKRAGWSARHKWWTHPLLYKEQWYRGHVHGVSLFGPRYLELRYEDLIQCPVDTLKKVCDFIQVPYEQTMLNFSDEARKLVDASESAWKSETMGPLLSMNHGKWKKSLGKWEIAWSECLNKRTMRQHGYIFLNDGWFRRFLLWPIAQIAASVFWAAYSFKLWKSR